METIYLSGNISELPETYLWREEYMRSVESRLWGMDANCEIAKVVEFLNPCEVGYNETLWKLARAGNKEEYDKYRSTSSQRLLPRKDYWMIKRSTLCVVNLAIVTADKPPIGTVHELRMCYDLGLPVIAIVGQCPSIWANHPFNAECINYTVKDVAEAVDIFFRYFIHRRRIVEE